MHNSSTDLENTFRMEVVSNSGNGGSEEEIIQRKATPKASKKPKSRFLKWMRTKTCFCSQPEKFVKQEKPMKPKAKGTMMERGDWPTLSQRKPRIGSMSFRKHTPDISDHIRQFNDPKYDAVNYQSCAISRYFRSLPGEWDSEFFMEKQSPEKIDQRPNSARGPRPDDGKSMSDSAAWTTMEHLERFFSLEKPSGKAIQANPIGGVDPVVSSICRLDEEGLDDVPTRLESSNMNFRAYVKMTQPPPISPCPTAQVMT